MREVHCFLWLIAAVFLCKETWLLIKILLTREFFSADPSLLRRQWNSGFGQNRHESLKWVQCVAACTYVWRAQFCLYRSQRCHSLPQTSMARKGETFTSSWLEQPAVLQQRALEQKASCSTQKEHNPNIYQHPEACMMNLVSNNGLNVTFRFFKEWGASQQLFQLSSPLGCVCVRGEILWICGSVSGIASIRFSRLIYIH